MLACQSIWPLAWLGRCRRSLTVLCCLRGRLCLSSRKTLFRLLYDDIFFQSKYTIECVVIFLGSSSFGCRPHTATSASCCLTGQLCGTGRLHTDDVWTHTFHECVTLTGKHNSWQVIGIWPRTHFSGKRLMHWLWSTIILSKMLRLRCEFDNLADMYCSCY